MLLHEKGLFLSIYREIYAKAGTYNSQFICFVMEIAMTSFSPTAKVIYTQLPLKSHLNSANSLFGLEIWNWLHDLLPSGPLAACKSEELALHLL